MPRTGWLACGALVGALLVSSTGVTPDGLLGVAAVGLVLAGRCLAMLGRIGPGLIMIGAAAVLARALLGGGPVETPPAEDPTQRSFHTATVVTIFAPQGGQQRAVLELSGTGGAATGRVYATLPRYPPLAPTDMVELDGRLEAAPPAGSSGFGEFLARSGIGYTLRSRQLNLVPTDLTPAAELGHLRRDAGDVLARVLPEPQAGLAAAIVIGLRDRVGREIAEDFRVAGLSHVVAISGFHVALVAALAGAVLSPLSRRPRSAALLVFLVAYALLAGASPSVLRATAMAGTVLLLRIAGRRGQASAALGMAVLVLLLIEPATVTEVGFQLSVAATAGLLRWAGPFGDRLEARLPRWLPRWVSQTLGVSLAAQLATLPLVVLHFGRLSLVAPLSNLMAAPLIAPAMGAAGASLGAGAIASAGLPEALLAPLQLIAALAIGGLVAVAQLCASLPLASVELAPPLDLLGAALATLVVIWFLRRPAQPHQERGTALLERRPTVTLSGSAARRPAAAAVALAAGLGLLVTLALGSQPDGRLHMTVLDVGQGDAILLVGPAGSRVLVDTGPDPDRLVRLLDARLPPWDRRLDLVVLTHPHEDHVAGLALLLDRYRIGAIAEPGMRGLGPGDAAYRARLAELGRSTRLLAAGDRLALDGAQVDVRWPVRGRVAGSPANGGKAVNNVSIVLDITFGGRRLLLTGDIEEEIDAQLRLDGDSGTGERPVDVLKVAHHGSATATTDAFLERIRPRIAVVSAGANNPYGHPSPRTLSRLVENGARVLRTDSDGSIVVSTDGSDLLVHSTGGRGAGGRAWLDDPPPPPSGPVVAVGFCPIPPPVLEDAPPAYNRTDGGALAPGGGAPASRARPARLAAAPLDSRGRGGRLHRRGHRRARQPVGPPARRVGRAAARPGQGAATR
jgi:competence protein ComEC